MPTIGRPARKRDSSSAANRSSWPTPVSDQKFWVGLDQVASSATNFGGSALAAGLLGARDFGAWAIGYTVLLVALTAVRTWTGDSLMLLAPKTGDPGGLLAKGCATFAGLVGIGAALIVFVSGSLTHDAVQDALWSVAICLPFVLLQDALRYALLALRRARAAFGNDLLWFVLSTSTLMALRRTDTQSVSLAMLAWAGSTLPCVLLGLAQTGVRLELRSAGRWIAESRSIASRILAEYVVFMMSSIVMLTIVVGVTGDIAGVGSIRGAQVLMGPVTILFAASTMYLQPILVRAYTNGDSILGRGVRQSVVNVIGTTTWLLVLFFVPRNVGTRVFGFTWDGSRSYLPLVGLVVFAAASSTGAINVLRSSGRVADSLRAHALIATIVILSTATGAIGWRANGAVYAFAVSSLVGPILLWSTVRRTRHGAWIAHPTTA